MGADAYLEAIAGPDGFRRDAKGSMRAVKAGKRRRDDDQADGWVLSRLSGIDGADAKLSSAGLMKSKASSKSKMPNLTRNGARVNQGRLS